MNLPDSFEFDKANRILEFLQKKRNKDNPDKKISIELFGNESAEFWEVGESMEKFRIISGTRNRGYYLNALSEYIIKDFGGQIDVFYNYTKSLEQSKRIADLTENLTRKRNRYFILTLVLGTIGTIYAIVDTSITLMDRNENKQEMFNDTDLGNSNEENNIRQHSI